MDSDHERQLEAHIECAELWGDYYHAKQNAEAEKLAKLEAFVDGLTIAQNQDGFTLLRFKKSAAFYKDDVHFDGETPLAAIYAYLDMYVICVDDLCHSGSGCIHGDGEILCPHCKGRGKL